MRLQMQPDKILPRWNLFVKEMTPSNGKATVPLIRFFHPKLEKQPRKNAEDDDEDDKKPVGRQVAARPVKENPAITEMLKKLQETRNFVEVLILDLQTYSRIANTKYNENLATNSNLKRDEMVLIAPFSHKVQI